MSRAAMMVVVMLLLLAGGASAAPLSYSAQPEFNDVATSFTLADDVKILVHAPSPAPRPDQQARLVFYALPNGNSTAQTFGRRVPQAERWRYGIQNIGAQARRLWADAPDQWLAVAYLEAPKKSWPSWRTATPDAPAKIRAMLDQTRQRVAPTDDGTTSTLPIELVAHSGGGAMLFSLIDGADAIPADIARLVWIDADYAYDRAKHHDRKLGDWLAANAGAHLRVLCYDDREIVLDGKKVISDTGGTWRRTHEMIDDLGARFPLTQTTVGDLDIWRGLNGRIELIVHRNPTNKILHTVLVERNGFLYVASPKSVADRARWLYTDHDYDALMGERPLGE